MALKLNCVFEQPSLSSKLIDLVQLKANKLNASKKDASVESVYNELREEGFEIDAESVAFAYMNAPKLKNRAGFSTTSQINKFGGAAIKNAIEIANKGTIKNAKTGKQTPVQSALTGLATTFQNLSNNNDVNKSRLFELQEVFKKYVNSKIDKKAVTSKFPKSNNVFDNLKLLFDVQDVQATSKEAMKGNVIENVKAIEDMFKELDEGINTIAAGIKDKAKRAEFEAMVKGIKDNTFDLMLTNKNANDVIMNVLKNISIDGKNKNFTKEVNKTTVSKDAQGKETKVVTKIDVVDWNKVLEDKDLSKEGDWGAVFGKQLMKEGFTEKQANLIVAKIDNNFKAVKEKAMENRLNQIAKNKDLKLKVNKLAIKKLVELKNAGIFTSTKPNIVKDAMGVGLPIDIATKIGEVITAYENSVSITKGTSPLELEIANRAIRNLMEGLDNSRIEKVINGFRDYQSLRSGSIIATTFNATQNVTSGMFSGLISSLSTIYNTKNPALFGRFLRMGFEAFMNVSKGGVQLRNGQSITTVDMLQGAGGLSDRWTFETAKTNMQKFGALLNSLSQITSTAFDAANKAIIADAAFINAAKKSLDQKGKSTKEANKIIDNILFGEANVNKWREKAKEALDKYPDELKGGKYLESRLADQFFYNELVDSGLFTIQNVIDIHSTSIEQAQINLGQTADVKIVESITAQLQKVADNMVNAKKNGDPAYAKYLIQHATLSFINMYVSGAINWTVLQMQNSFGALIYTGGSLAVDYLQAKQKGTLPPAFQKLDFENSENLKMQLAAKAKLRARLERNLIGATLQMGFGFLVKAMLFGIGDEDKEREKILVELFEEYMNDPVARRFLDKVLPMSLAAELGAAYDKKTGVLDKEKLSSYWGVDNKPSFAKINYFWEKFSNQDGLDRLNKTLNYAIKIKDEEKKATAVAEAFSSFFGGMLQLPYVTQEKIVSDEMDFVNSGFKADSSRKAKRDKENEQMKKDIDGAVDAAIVSAIGYDYFKLFFK